MLKKEELKYLKGDPRIRFHLERAAEIFDVRNHAIEELIKMDLIEGKTRDARILLENNYYRNEDGLSNLYGLLELNENNYKTALSYFRKCLSLPDFRDKSRIYIGQTLVNLGEYGLAEKVFASLKNRQNIKIDLLLQLIYLAILKGDYEKADYYLKQAPRTNLEERIGKIFLNLESQLDVWLGRVTTSSNKMRIYSFKRLLTPLDEEVLIRHIKRHADESRLNTLGCFFQDLDYEKLLRDVKERMANLNPTYFKGSEVYRMHLDYFVGLKNKDCPTKDVAVLTALNSEIIFSIYPIMLSDDFDKESYQKSEELRLKRSLK